ncbi:general odorant-binding protein 28a-like [Bradysia coprophila]|uniref:general odorant-binding protein 28a-like n=1 Tax=Bradysia coprophila TaxID=38358 RepID=UPI00187DD8CE|nr:general odorant-binding protein 28a-like [Bradysia coprophila]
MGLLVKIVFLACVLVATAKPLTEEERQSMIMELVGKCKSAEGASDADVQGAMAQQPPTTRSGQCFHACMMETLGVMIGGKLSAEGSARLAEGSGDPEKIKNSEAITKECISVGGGERCESAAAIVDCVAAAAAKLGIDPTKDLN